MPAPTMLFAIGVELILVDILRYFKVPAPCRISSLPQGAPLRPGVYAYIEDICAVDGSGGTQFRQRLNLRYQASKAFREMLHRQTLFWAIGAIVCSAATTAIVFTIQRDAAYVVSIFPYKLLGIKMLIRFRLVGYFRSFGRVFGRLLLSLGSSAILRGSMRSGRRQISKRSSNRSRMNIFICLWNGDCITTNQYLTRISMEKHGNGVQSSKATCKERRWDGLGWGWGQY